MKFCLPFLVLLVSCLNMGATVIYYQPTNNYLGPAGGLLDVDVNNDGYNDFQFGAYSGWSGDVVWIDGLNNGSKMLTDGANRTRGLNDNILIGSNFPSNLWEVDSELFRWSQGFSFPLEVITNVPIQILINGNVHYGYMMVYISSVSGYVHFNLYRVAYEDVPGLSIKSASMSSITGVADELEANFSMAVMPEHLNLSLGGHYRSNLVIFSMDGRKALETSFVGKEVMVPIGSLASGIYLLRMELQSPKGSTVLTRKFHHLK